MGGGYCFGATMRMSDLTDRITARRVRSQLDIRISGGQERVSNTTEHVFIPCPPRLRATLLCALREGTPMEVDDRQGPQQPFP